MRTINVWIDTKDDWIMVAQIGKKHQGIHNDILETILVLLDGHEDVLDIKLLDNETGEEL